MATDCIHGTKSTKRSGQGARDGGSVIRAVYRDNERPRDGLRPPSRTATSGLPSIDRRRSRRGCDARPNRTYLGCYEGLGLAARLSLGFDISFCSGGAFGREPAATVSGNRRCDKTVELKVPSLAPRSAAASA